MVMRRKSLDWFGAPINTPTGPSSTPKPGGCKKVFWPLDAAVPMEETTDILEHLGRIDMSVLRHFIQEGICTSCNNPILEHQVRFEFEPDSNWTTCFTENGNNANGPWWVHYCVRSEDHPDRVTREEFEELYNAP